MKKILNTLFLLMLVFTYTSCSDSEYDDDNFYAAKFHKILLFKDSGKRTLSLITPQTDYQDTLTVYKSGTDPSLTADVTFKVLDQATVDVDYNDAEGVDYRVIPSEAFSLNEGNTMHFDKGEKGKYLTVTLHADKIYDFKESSANVTSKTKFILPIKMVSEKDTINTDKNTTLYILNVEKPFITVAPKGNIYAAFTYSSVDINIPAAVTTVSGADIVNDRDFACELVSDPTRLAELFQIYKDGHAGYDCALMPSGNYTMPVINFYKGDNNANGVITIKRTGLQNEKHYVIPLEIKSSTMPSSQFNSKIRYLIVTPPTVAYDTNPSRSNWKVVFCNNDLAMWQAGSGGDFGGPAALLDGNVSTYWHSNWAGCFPEAYNGQDKIGKNTGHAAGDDYCYYYNNYHAFAAKRKVENTAMVFDMGESMHVIGIGFTQRQDHFDMKSFDVYVSDDDSFQFKPLESGGKHEDYDNPSLNNWTKLCSVTPAQQKPMSYTRIEDAKIISGGVKGRYLKIRFTGSWRPISLNGAEITVIKLLSVNGEEMK